MTQADKITKKLEQLNSQSTPAMREKILSEASLAMEQTIEDVAANKLSVGRIIMKSNITKFAAAIIIIAAITTIYQLTGSIDGASVAWADVIKRIDEVKDYTCRQRQIEYSDVKPTGYNFRQEWVWIQYYSAQFGHRWDMYQSDRLINQCYTLKKEQQFISLNPDRKTFRCHNDPSFQTMRIDPRVRIRKIIAEPHIILGQKMINGVLAEGIEVKGQKVSGWGLDDAVSRLWVDVQTQLPIRLESEGKMRGKDMFAILIQDQFQWNVNLIESDFTPDIPADFTQEKPISTETNPRWNEVVARYEQQDISVDFTPLQELGLLFDDQLPKQPVNTLTSMEEINEARDNMIRSWPSYDDLYQSLYDMLDDKLDLYSMSVDKLVDLGILLREKFWDAGGTYSPISYRYAYMSRVLLELAHEQHPHDLTIGDELAEAIMAAGSMVGPKERRFAETLMALRSSQFEQIRKEVKAGRKPCWNDFGCGCDLAYLASCRKPEVAVAAVDWLIEHAQEGRWTSCMKTLLWARPLVEKGEGVGFNIYYPIKPGFPEEFRYGGRLPSFKGPQSRIVIPIPEMKEPLPSDSQP